MHFTYEAALDTTSLHQGDLIKRTDAVDRLIAEVHPHFSRPEYPFFCVLTQSCDLVIRGAEPCATRYITIAAVRRAEDAWARELPKYQRTPAEVELGFCNELEKVRLVQFVQRLLNNNEPRYFFLFRESSVGLHEDYVGFLQLTVALKSDLHYTDLLNAKVLQLKAPFQHKLGHLVGNMYSRIGTDDWVPTVESEQDFQKRAQAIVDPLALWLERDIYKSVTKEISTLGGQSPVTLEALRQFIESSKKAKDVRVSEAIDQIAQVLSTLGVDPATIERTKNHLRVKQTFRSMVK